MPVASKTYLEFEVKRLNKTIGTNLVLGKSDLGYTIYCDSSRTSEINCCMKYRDVISFLVTMRSFFQYKNLKNQVSINLKKEEYKSSYKPSKLKIN